MLLFVPCRCGLFTWSVGKEVWLTCSHRTGICITRVTSSCKAGGDRSHLAGMPSAALVLSSCRQCRIYFMLWQKKKAHPCGIFLGQLSISTASILVCPKCVASSLMWHIFNTMPIDINIVYCVFCLLKQSVRGNILVHPGTFRFDGQIKYKLSK